jgi:hypothetical protein
VTRNGWADDDDPTLAADDDAAGYGELPYGEVLACCLVCGGLDYPCPNPAHEGVQLLHLDDPLDGPRQRPIVDVHLPEPEEQS